VHLRLLGVAVALIVCGVVVLIYFLDSESGTGGLPGTNKIPSRLLAPASMRGVGTGFIDRSGAFVIPPTYSRAYPFSEGLALVQKGPYFGFIDTSGAVRIPITRPAASVDVGLSMFGNFVGFSSGLFLVHDQEAGPYYIDKAGKNAFGCHFDQASDFLEGRAVVRRKGDNAFTVISPEGNTIGTILDETSVFSCSGSLINVRRGVGVGYIGWDGKEVVPCVYDWVSVFSEGLCVAYKEGEPVVFYDENGQQILKPGSLLAMGFHDGYCPVGYWDAEGPCKFGLIDKDGKVVLDYKWWSVAEYTLGLWAVQDNETRKWGYLDLKGRWVIEPKYSSAKPFTDPERTNVY